MTTARDNRETAAFEVEPCERWVIVSKKCGRDNRRFMFVDTVRPTRGAAWRAFSEQLSPGHIARSKRKGVMALRVFLSTEMASQ